MINARGNRVLSLSNHFYMLDYHAGAKSRWRCIKKNAKCKASITTIENTIVKVNGIHNHSENRHAESRLLKASLRQLYMENA